MVLGNYGCDPCACHASAQQLTGCMRARTSKTTAGRRPSTHRLAALPKPGEFLYTATEPVFLEEPRTSLCMPPSSTPRSSTSMLESVTHSTAPMPANPRPALPLRIRQKAPASPSTPDPQAAPARSSRPGPRCWRLPGECFPPVPCTRPDARFPRKHLPGAQHQSEACPS